MTKKVDEAEWERDLENSLEWIMPRLRANLDVSLPLIGKKWPLGVLSPMWYMLVNLTKMVGLCFFLKLDSRKTSIC